jgi:nitrate/nitrite transporter NarK
MTSRLLVGGLGGFFVAGLLRVLLPDPTGLGKALLQALVLVVVSLVIYRALARRSAD